MARECGMSINTYIKYFNECQKKGFIRIDGGGNYCVASYKTVFTMLFGESGRYISITRGKNLQETKENIRAAVAYNNLKNQDFLITGDCLFESGVKAKGLRASKALSWVKNRASFRAFGVKEVRTSSRSIAKVIGMSHATANKALYRLLQLNKVTYEYQQSFYEVKGSTQAKIAFAEQNRPFYNCTYSLCNGGVKFHLGRIVNFK